MSSHNRTMAVTWPWFVAAWPYVGRSLAVAMGIAIPWPWHGHTKDIPRSLNHTMAMPWPSNV
eukprot:437490-Lingulodinium_polyedra.AAC.1